MERSAANITESEDEKDKSRNKITPITEKYENSYGVGLSPLNIYGVADPQIFHQKSLYSQLYRMIYALAASGISH
jgi:hypothetical protein